jgi:hypothetical protein
MPNFSSCSTHFDMTPKSESEPMMTATFFIKHPTSVESTASGRVRTPVKFYPLSHANRNYA